MFPTARGMKVDCIELISKGSSMDNFVGDSTSRKDNGCVGE